MNKRIKSILLKVTEIIATLKLVVDFLKSVSNSNNELKLKMDEILRVCGNKTIVYQKIEVPVPVNSPCCVEEVMLYTSKPSYYKAMWDSLVGQTGGNRLDVIYTRGKVRAFVLQNTTDLYVKFYLTQMLPYGQIKDRKDLVNVYLKPMENIIINLPQPIDLAGYQGGASNFGFVTSFYSNSAFTQSAILRVGLIEIAVISHGQCKPTNITGGSSSIGSKSLGGNVGGGIGFNTLNNMVTP